MAKMSLDALTKALRQNSYTARTDEQLQQEAEARVGASYEAMRNAATQRQSMVDEAYARELQSLSDTLATGQQAVAQQAARSNAAIDEYVNSRSMQRTSYSAGSKGSITANLEKAAQALMQKYNTAAGGINNNRILLAEQLAGTLAQYDQDYLTDVQAYIDEQKQIDYDRQVAADAAYNDLQTALFELGKTGSSGGGGYRRSSGGGSPSPTSPGNGNDVINAINDFSKGDASASKRQASSGVNVTFGTTNQNTTGGTLLKRK